jgi:hypothetical protein
MAVSGLANGKTPQPVGETHRLRWIDIYCIVHQCLCQAPILENMANPITTPMAIHTVHG